MPLFFFAFMEDDICRKGGQISKIEWTIPRKKDIN